MLTHPSQSQIHGEVKMYKSVIYKIINKVNKHIYIGSTCRFPDRRYKHLHELELNIHKNHHLQSAYNKYGASGLKTT